MKTIKIGIKSYHFTAQIEKDSKTGLYIGIVPDVSGAHTQAKSLDKLKKNMQEVLELCLEKWRRGYFKFSFPSFIGIFVLCIQPGFEVAPVIFIYPLKPAVYANCF